MEDAWIPALSAGIIRLINPDLAASLSDLYCAQEIATQNVERLANGVLTSSNLFNPDDRRASVRLLWLTLADILSAETVLQDALRNNYQASRREQLLTHAFVPGIKEGVLFLRLCTAVLMISAAAAAQQTPGDGGGSPRSSSWRQIVTPDLIVVGNAPTGELKRILSELTRFRDTLARMFPDAAVTSPVPTRVVVLRDYDEFRRFQPRDSRGRPQANVGGYFSRGADVNSIVLPASRGESSLETIFHEYTHYFVSRNVRAQIPGWLNEGLADFYSTFRGDFRGKTLIGAIPQYPRAHHERRDVRAAA